MTDGKYYRWQYLTGAKSQSAVDRWTYRGACLAAWRWGRIDTEEEKRKWYPANEKLTHGGEQQGGK